MTRLAIALLTLAPLAASLVAGPQSAGKVPRVGWVWVGQSGGDPSKVAGFRRALPELG